MALKYQIRIQLKETRGRPRKNLSDDKKAWLIEVLGRSDLKNKILAVLTMFTLIKLMVTDSICLFNICCGL